MFLLAFTNSSGYGGLFYFVLRKNFMNIEPLSQFVASCTSDSAKENLLMIGD